MVVDDDPVFRQYPMSTQYPMSELVTDFPAVDQLIVVGLGILVIGALFWKK